MTLKKLFKKHPEYLNKKITIVDITNHLSFELNTNYLLLKQEIFDNLLSELSINLSIIVIILSCILLISPSDIFLI